MRLVRKGEDPGTYVFETDGGKRVVVEMYDDAQGGRVVAGDKYIGEAERREMGQMLHTHIDPRRRR